MLAKILDPGMIKPLKNLLSHFISIVPKDIDSLYVLEFSIGLETTLTITLVGSLQNIATS